MSTPSPLAPMLALTDATHFSTFPQSPVIPIEIASRFSTHPRVIILFAFAFLLTYLDIILGILYVIL